MIGQAAVDPPARLAWLRRLLRFAPFRAVRQLVFRTGAVRWFWRYRHLIDRSYRSLPPTAVAPPHRQQLVALIRPLAPASILEVGCGLGENLEVIARHLGDVTLAGLDLNAAGLAIASKRLPELHAARAIFRQGSAEALPFETASMDVVLSDAVFMYFPESTALKALGELVRVARVCIVVHLFADESLGASRLIDGNWVHDFPSLLRRAAPHASIRSRQRSHLAVGQWVTYGTVYVVDVSAVASKGGRADA